MSRSAVCYPQPGKAKSRRVLEAFADGCKGSMRVSPAAALEPGAAAFYGVVGIEHLLRLARAESRDFYYGDNAFFDVCRGKFYRFAKNELQVATLQKPRHDRLEKLFFSIRPWQRGGKHIVIVEQSQHFLDMVGKRQWLLRLLKDLKPLTDRPLRVRSWQRDKLGAGRSLQEDLRGAHALVTDSSAAANEALIAGVPVFVSGRCAALPLASGALSAIESPLYPDGREEWAAGLAGMQWTLDEIRSGAAWRALEGG